MGQGNWFHPGISEVVRPQHSQVSCPGMANLTLAYGWLNPWGPGMASSERGHVTNFFKVPGTTPVANEEISHIGPSRQL